jgi:hypothetical protein
MARACRQRWPAWPGSPAARHAAASPWWARACVDLAEIAAMALTEALFLQRYAAIRSG